MKAEEAGEAPASRAEVRDSGSLGPILPAYDDAIE